MLLLTLFCSGFNTEVLKAFAELFNFNGSAFDQALRKYLYTFRLPGEAQKIDRMMESFAQRYFEQNPEAGVFQTSGKFFPIV